MAKFRVMMVETAYKVVEVEAPDEDEALELAERAFDEDGHDGIWGDPESEGVGDRYWQLA